MNYSDKITELRGIGETTAKLFARLGIRTIADLIDYFPKQYDDYSNTLPIRQIKPGNVSIKAKIRSISSRYARRGLHITEAIASDDTGSVRLVWFNQSYRAQSIKNDKDYYISGKFELSHRRLVILSPSIELVSDFQLNTARIIPIYRETKGLSSRQIRQAVYQVLDMIKNVPETLPNWLVKKYGIDSISAALLGIHFPESSEQLENSRKRLGFEEVFGLVLASLLNKREILMEHAPKVKFDEKLAREFVSHLPFTLTNAQRKAIWQIYQDMQNNHPMNRLVEGDVGSGKTVVAAMAAVMVLHEGHQVALMAPTEILARQHADTLIRLFQPLHLDNKVGLLVGGMLPQFKRNAYTHIATGKMQFIVGTHALIQDAVDIRNLELVIIDEQHRFGVEQRKELIAKAGHMPHVLNLTATPIPRSLALTLYGELDISILDEKPPGRQSIETVIYSPVSRQKLYEQLREHLNAQGQIYIVCPLITDSTSLHIKSAEQIYSELSNNDFKEFKVGLMHGRLKPVEKQQIMRAFMNHEIDILVSTTVIEVGVDVPNATVMVIEGADRFGLAQIHQLRGRVGRGDRKSYCYLVMSDTQAPSPRLRALERTSDGFKLAELDLAIRGPGAIYGTFQHGQLDLRIAKLTDLNLIKIARQAAEAFVNEHEDIAAYPVLDRRVRRLRSVNNLN